MKVRHGFVSNSSSSSFLVLLPAKQGSVDSYELREQLFGKQEKMPKGQIDAFVYYKEAFDKEHVADVIAKDLNEKKFIGFSYSPITKEEYTDSFNRMVEDLMQYVEYYCFSRDNMFIHTPDVHEIFAPLIEQIKVIGKAPEHTWDHTLSEEERQKAWKKQWAEDEKWRKNARKVIVPILKKFLKENSKKYDFFITEYSDNDGRFWSAMEHGGLFENVPHMQFSHH